MTKEQRDELRQTVLKKGWPTSFDVVVDLIDQLNDTEGRGELLERQWAEACEREQVGRVEADRALAHLREIIDAHDETIYGDNRFITLFDAVEAARKWAYAARVRQEGKGT